MTVETHERWRRPLLMHGVRPDPRWYVRYKDGRTLEGFDFAASPEDHERLREGRACLKCGEPFEQPFPPVCTLEGCGFPVRERQLELYEHLFGGEEWLGPRETLDEELARLPDHRKQSKIVLPKGVR